MITLKDFLKINKYKATILDIENHKNITDNACQDNWEVVDFALSADSIYIGVKKLGHTNGKIISGVFVE